MNVRGYMIEVTLSDDALTIEGTTKPSRIALRGEQHGDGPVVIPRADIASVDHKRAGVMINGRLTVKTVDGEKYLLHYRHKSNDEFRALADALN